MEKVLIVVGLGISYLCWVTKREYDYIEKKNHENSIGTESILEKKKRIQIKLQSNEKLTKMELFDWYSYKFADGVLFYGIYGGFALSIIGFIMLLINK
ncbi:hypothetical protein [Sulfurimonas sp.]|uniref:hypothetical protein n=1 Tax=Sulfurimonas sp. TaxID=2022749 RepID=UPI00286E7E28|nr:hypothetical protein [Sulfurimonas sp.]